jgi:hypothetical protein
MNRENVLLNITALVDNELDEQQKNKLKIRLNVDESLRKELRIQVIIKLLLQNGIFRKPAPKSLRKNIFFQLRKDLG